MNIYITRCHFNAAVPDAEKRMQDLHLNRQAHLFSLYETSRRQHALVDDADHADVIFVMSVNASTESLIRRYPEKCFALDENDDPQGVLRGIYACNRRSIPLFWTGRFRTGCYQLYPSVFANPAVQSHLGDAWLHPKKYLATFVGRMSHRCREEIMTLEFSRPDILTQNSSEFDLFSESGEKRSFQERFAKMMEESKFVLCPRGAGASSIRLFEAMQMGVAPIIISDDWVAPKGPDWSAFSIRLPEGSTELESMLVENELHYEEMGRQARAAWERFFSDETHFDYLVAQATDIMRTQWIPEKFLWNLRSAIAFRDRIMRGLKRRLCKITLSLTI